MIRKKKGQTPQEFGDWLCKELESNVKKVEYDPTAKEFGPYRVNDAALNELSSCSDDRRRAIIKKVLDNSQPRLYIHLDEALDLVGLESIVEMLSRKRDASA